MPKITFLPSNKTIEVKTGTELLDASRFAEVDIQASCGGKGTCGNCIMHVDSGEVDFDEIGLLGREVVEDGYVLACKTTVKHSPLTISLSGNFADKIGKFADDYEDIDLVKRELMPDKTSLNPAIKIVHVTVPLPRPEDGLADLDRLTRVLDNSENIKDIEVPLQTLKSLGDNVRKKDGSITVTLVENKHGLKKILSVEPGKSVKPKYGLAIDMGTTTVAVQLITLPDGEIVGTKTQYNEQIKCGLDIISRINYSMKTGRLEELRSLALNTINNLIDKLYHRYKVSSNYVVDCVVSGNPTMVHLLLGLNPDFIRLEPYTPTIMHTDNYKAGEIGININPEAFVYFSPAVGSYVGGDITAGLLCTNIPKDKEKVNMFIDIGTNGEIVIGNHDFMMACACSAGPAFEGGGIENGMRAAVGAIENIDIDTQTGKPELSTIGNALPIGICGSGIISLLANLLKTGWLDQNGKLPRDRKSDYIEVEGKNAYFVLVKSDDNNTNTRLRVSELEIENVIRAKAAIYSASSLLLEQLGLGFRDLGNIFIAGGFGRFLDIENAKIIGLVPDIALERFKYIGNSSLMGSYLLLVSRDYRNRQLELAGKMTYIDLSTDPNYMNQHTAALFLPHTDMDKFPSVKKYF